MRSASIWFGLTGALAGLLAGCSGPPAATSPTLARVSALTPEAYERLWDTVGDTLRDNYFGIDREDRLAGIISTHPETRAQFFELWRPQPELVYTWVESNLQTTQLQATVTIKPVEEAGAFDVAVQVDRLRYSLEERQIDNSAGAMRLFSADTPTEGGEKERPSRTGETITLGRDKPAEERLLKLIMDRYAKAPAPATQPAGAG